MTTIIDVLKLSDCYSSSCCWCRKGKSPDNSPSSTLHQYYFSPETYTFTLVTPWTLHPKPQTLHCIHNPFTSGQVATKCVCIKKAYRHIYICMYTHAHTHTDMCTYLAIYILYIAASYAYTRGHIHAYSILHIPIYLHKHMRIITHTHTQTRHMHACMHAYIHTSIHESVQACRQTNNHKYKAPSN